MRRTRNEYEHFSAEKWCRTRNEYEYLSARRWVAILIPKILRYSFKQAQCRQAQGRLCSGPSLALRHARLIEILRLSGYFIQLLRYTAPPDARCTTVRLRSVETASLPMA